MTDTPPKAQRMTLAVKVWESNVRWIDEQAARLGVDRSTAVRLLLARAQRTVENGDPLRSTEAVS